MTNTILAQLSFPPSQPPPAKPMTTVSRSSRKAFYAAIIIVVLVIAVLVPVFVFLIPNMLNTNPAAASSVKFTQTIQTTVEGLGNHTIMVLGTVYAKNLGTPNMMCRWEYGVMEQLTIYIVNETQHKVWRWSFPKGWVDFSSGFDWGKWMQGWNETETRLRDWQGGDITYTDQGYAIRISDIQINPSLDDSLFTP